MLNQNPRHAISPGLVIVWLVVASWERAKDIIQSSREFPLVHLPPTQAAMAANKQCCAIKVFVKKICSALWAILKALFRLAGSEKERKETGFGSKPELVRGGV